MAERLAAAQCVKGCCRSKIIKKNNMDIMSALFFPKDFLNDS